MNEKHYDIIISGAGPAGCSCALALRDSGLRIALLDKASFPRDKICGDFVAAKGIRELLRIAPGLKGKLEELPHKVINRSTELIVGDLSPLRLDWVLKSYTIKREIFDNILLEAVLELDNVDFYPAEAVRDISRENGLLKVRSSLSNIFSAPMIVGADGAHSVVSRQLAGYKVDHEYYGGSVRAYYSGLKNIDPAVNEVYVHKQVLPGYFWLFPISETEANVGVGMHSRHISRDKINIKEVFYKFLETSPLLQDKMEHAVMEGKLQGFGLPFYSRDYQISGDHFLLCGDAASMIDPTNGEGIMPAIFSGGMAAEHLIRAFEKQDFSAGFNADYARMVHGKYWKEMKLKTWLVNNFADKNRILNAVAWMCVKSPLVKKGLQKFL